jgi:hypothetical protein
MFTSIDATFYKFKWLLRLFFRFRRFFLCVEKWNFLCLFSRLWFVIHVCTAYNFVRNVIGKKNLMLCHITWKRQLYTIYNIELVIWSQVFPFTQFYCFVKKKKEVNCRNKIIVSCQDGDLAFTGVLNIYLVAYYWLFSLYKLHFVLFKALWSSVPWQYTKDISN